MRLLNANNREIKLPAVRQNWLGENHTITAIVPPSRPGSAGKVVTDSGRLYYPMVFNLRIAE